MKKLRVWVTQQLYIMFGCNVSLGICGDFTLCSPTSIKKLQQNFTLSYKSSFSLFLKKNLWVKLHKMYISSLWTCVIITACIYCPSRICLRLVIDTSCIHTKPKQANNFPRNKHIYDPVHKWFVSKQLISPLYRFEFHHTTAKLWALTI